MSHTSTGIRRRGRTLCVSGRYPHAIVVATSGVAAVDAALDVLKVAGSALDAALTAAIVQVALSAGSWASYAGIMSLLYYDAATRTVHSLNAGYDVPRRETDALTIPGPGMPSGRTALVPGFMAGVQAAHDRFGRLPFKRLFEPAIDIAANGFRIGAPLDRLLRWRRDVLARHPGAREVFVGRNGRLCTGGDVLRQPALARLLRRVAREGATWMYAGPWAHRLVSELSRDGGRLTLADLRRYRARWTRPLRGTYHGFEVAVPGLPGYGGVHTIETLNLLEYADLARHGHWSRSPQALRTLIQATQATYARWFRGGSSRVQKRAARQFWRRVHADRRGGGLGRASGHSDALVVVDENGNIASVCHSSNAIAWGTTGIFVEGVSIPDSACYQRMQVRQAGPGNRLPDPMNPLIVFRHEEPVLASSCIGSSLHETTIQCVVSVLDFGMSLREAILGPQIMGPVWRQKRSQRAHSKRRRGSGNNWTGSLVQTVESGHFSRRTLATVRRMGQRVEIADGEARPGYWAAIRMGRVGMLEGAVTSRVNENIASVDGY
jgi:gamma-glutamyltranspeptidase/glutathione hydrolase